MRLKCVIFDMDGTVFEAPYDWPRIRADLDTNGKPILAYLSELDEPQRSLKWKILEDYERKATLRARLKEGIPELLNSLKTRGIIRALVTNNSQKNVFYLLRKFKIEFDYVLTRDSGLWKPSAAPLQEVLRTFALDPMECCLVGDSHFDIQAGVEAGLPHIFILKSSGKKIQNSQGERFQSIRDIQTKIDSLD